MELIFTTPIHASVSHGATSSCLLSFFDLAVAQWCDNSHYNTCEEINVLIKKEAWGLCFIRKQTLLDKVVGGI